MNITEKLNSIIETKEAIKTSIQKKGIKVSDTEPFANYAEKINNIETGDLSEYFSGTLNGGSPELGWYSNMIKIPSIPSDPTCTTFAYSYGGCPATIIDITKLDWSNISYTQSMFSGCKNLIEIIGIENEINMSKVRSMQAMFYNCEKIVNLNLSNITVSQVNTLTQMFMNNKSLKSLNVSSWNFNTVTSVNGMFLNCNELIDLQFGVNLGAAYDTNIVANYNNYKLDLSTCTSLTETSLISVLNSLYDIATKGCNIQSCILGEINLAKLTSEEGQAALAQATSYGWAIA